jgi:cellulose synthase/poly-beta-1,6-N-acetylglucosamine synthase-like glycosyltransferase
VTCLPLGANADTASGVISSLAGIVNAEVVILSSFEREGSQNQVILVMEGTKLSKLRRFAETVNSDFVCICDPDLEVRGDATRAVVAQAIEASGGGEEVVAFGLIDSRNDGNLLANLIAIDKWLSHRILRPALWGCGMGITLPGQFLVLSASVLQRLDPAVDSYLDDLYLGWIAYSTGVRIERVPEVVGLEESRATWGSLLTQRLRWMRGFMSLVRHLSANPKALGLLFAHFVAYYGLPILWLISVSILAIISMPFAVGIVVITSILLARLSRQPFVAAVTFLTLFPLLHCFAVLLWWVPISRHRLTQR